MSWSQKCILFVQLQMMTLLLTSSNLTIIVENHMFCSTDITENQCLVSHDEGKGSGGVVMYRIVAQQLLESVQLKIS